MAPSPQDKRLPNEVRNYGDSWRTIMHLVRSGYSWSGKERNCVFLNCPSTNEPRESRVRFANASAVSGLDFPDDGRSVAVVDWDHDGDLDLWFRNRTAPRLRLMRNLTNEIAPDNQHISIRLIGTTCNRDAIGARAEVVLKTTGSSNQRLVRSVRAGDAFMSQSSKWLHFGIDKDASVEQLIIDWPSGERERFQEVPIGVRYEITQGSGKVIPLERREPVSLVAKPYSPMPQTGAARVVLPGRVALPPITLPSDDSPESAHDDSLDAPKLIIFWTSSCPNCRHELTDIAKHRSEFEQANLNVLAICLDGLDQHDSSNSKSNDTNDAKTFLQDIEFPFQAERATREMIELIRQFQNVLFNKYPKFVVPLSFLVDSDEQVVSIYRGAFPCETILKDRALVDLDDETLRTLATPFLGTWITKPATRSQFAEFIGGRMMANEPKAAIRYYEAAVKTEDDADRQKALRQQIERLKRFVERRE